jgi:hypothetical protein
MRDKGRTGFDERKLTTVASAYPKRVRSMRRSRKISLRRMRSSSSVTPIGKSNAADFLKEYLKTHHPGISRRVIATENADLSAVTEPEIEALAKRHMIAVV